MVDVAQLVEPRIVIPAVAGSSPVVHPTPSMDGLQRFRFPPTSCAVGHSGETRSTACSRRWPWRHTVRSGRLCLDRYLLRFLGLVPALSIAAIYGRVTGDIATAASVMALLFGMWFGLQLGRGRPERTSG